MEHESNIDNSSMNFLRKDALERLEWNKLTKYLSEYSISPHTKTQLLQLDPWLDASERDFFFVTTAEMLDLTTQGNNLTLEAFDLEMFEKPLKRGALLSPHALFQVLIVVRLCHILQAFFKFERSRAQRFPKLYELILELKPQVNLCAKLQKSVDIEGHILSSASTELHSARSRLENAKRRIVEHLEDILRKQEVKNAVQDSVWMLRDGRYVLPVRADRKGDIDGIPRGVSQSGSTIFLEPHALAQQHTQLEKAQSDVEIEEQRIIKELSKDCYLVCEDIINSSDILTKLDNISARTRFAGAIVGTKPKFLNANEKTKRFSLIEAKHPLFLLEKKKCVANDLELKPQKENHISPKIWVLSGPNAGGKTVAMKTVGMTVLMAKAGLFVACEKAEILDYENIFVELGDRQNREEDLSTFSGHLSQIKKVTEAANEFSLILLDEGFVGTDPAIGVAMARATLELFAEKNATVIITTHFSNLKTLADGDPRFYNGSMEFEPHKLLPTYKVLSGIPGQSYAIELAERMGLSKDIISKARQYYGNESQRMENILRDLQLKRIQIKEELSQQAELSKNLESELKALKHEREKLSELRNDLVDGYRAKLQKRLNAYENRLDIRERQFEKQKESFLKDLRNEHSENINTIENIGSQSDDSSAVNKYTIPTKEIQSRDSSKPQKLSGFDALAGLKLPKKKKNEEEKQFTSLDERAQKFRAPRHMSTRSLLDEAKESLELLNDSFDDIESNLEDDIHSLEDLENSTKNKAKKAKETAQTIQAQGRTADHWQVGMKVKSSKFKDNGTVLRSADGKGNVECQFGIMKVKIHFHELSEIDDQISKAQNKTIKINGKSKNKTQLNSQKKFTNIQDHEIPPTLQHSGNTINLRGKTVDEALDKLDIELDKMSRLEVDRVVIIHGHGMGKIKESVRKFLEDASYKLKFRAGRQGEGGDGVTIVEFEN
ncbi:endonuclease MutS2 [Fluviispira multicolorata]|uniref:Endonuclease MutS2 n=1 Tax=Fluviispira multicolorata TaxID=2654512 RepID=A0A833N555_9BACT|nr:Smr/MutS family protein [Fluviispira multicolorata]KAB8032183.1 hypothetical protein GCL57_05930 [Fluviispira multicolorata]